MKNCCNLLSEMMDKTPWFACHVTKNKRNADNSNQTKIKLNKFGTFLPNDYIGNLK